MIAIHCGVGKLDSSLEINRALQSLCKRVCSHALSSIGSGKESLAACTDALAQLEDSFLTNSGYGSCLTNEKTVELEAAVMESNSKLFGGVSCIRRFKNPIMVAKSILEDQKKPMNALVPPQYLSGLGAESYATSKGFLAMENSSLISSRAARQAKKCEVVLTQPQASVDAGTTTTLDTVGAICVDLEGVITAGASSGGIILRKEGRVGHVSLPCGSGVWAEQTSSTTSVAACTTGLGELIARGVLARSVCNALKPWLENDEDAIAPISKCAMDTIHSHRNSTWSPHLGGLVVSSAMGKRERILCFHTSWKMLIAFGGVSQGTVQTEFVPGPSNVGSTCVVQEWQA